MKPTMPPINSSDNLFHDGDLATQRDGTPVTAEHLNNVQASVIDVQNELKSILTQTGATPNNVTGQVATAIVELVNLKLTKLSQAIAFSLSPTIPDGAQPYQAVNLRQLQAAGSGGGASLSGVMNNFIGAVEWFNGSRAKIPAGYVAADGQVVSRTAQATMDLWAAVNAGMLNSKTDTQWLNGPGNPLPKGQFRGMYSTGGTSNPPSGSGVTGAWFRVPDLNGVLADSIPALFLRGDAGGRIGTEIGGVGEVLPAAAPEIGGEVSMTTGGGFTQAFHIPSGAFSGYNKAAGNTLADGPGAPTADRFTTAEFKASRSSPVYGRKNADGVVPATELRPNSVAGIWIIRASGSFTAANTEFQVINKDATNPPTGTIITGGKFTSFYSANNNAGMSAQMWAEQKWGTAGASLVLSVSDNVAGVRKNLVFNTGGDLVVPGPVRADKEVAAIASQAGGSVQSRITTSGSERSAFGLFTSVGNSAGGETRYGNLALTSDANPGTTKNWQFDAGGGFNCPGVVYAQGSQLTSDRTFKDKIERIADPLAKLEKISGYTYVMKETGATSAGVIAQELEGVLPEVVKKVDDHLTVEYTGVDALLVEAVKELSAQVRELKKELAELKAK